MWCTYNYVCPHTFGSGNCLLYVGCVHHVHPAWIRKGEDVCAVAEVEDSQPYSFYIVENRIELLLLFLVAVYSNITGSSLFISLYCVEKSPFSFVEKMVVCQKEEVYAALLCLPQDGLRGREQRKEELQKLEVKASDAQSCLTLHPYRL